MFTADSIFKGSAIIFLHVTAVMFTAGTIIQGIRGSVIMFSMLQQ